MKSVHIRHNAWQGKKSFAALHSQATRSLFPNFKTWNVFFSGGTSYPIFGPRHNTALFLLYKLQ